MYGYSQKEKFLDIIKIGGTYYKEIKIEDQEAKELKNILKNHRIVEEKLPDIPETIQKPHTIPTRLNDTRQNPSCMFDSLKQGIYGISCPCPKCIPKK